jgi:hypothetical protein
MLGAGYGCVIRRGKLALAELVLLEAGTVLNMRNIL